MDVPARFKWCREKDRFAAYPSAKDHDQRFMMIRLYNSGINTDLTPHRPFESWHWLVRWDGWFSEFGFADSKQAAADWATEAWWKWIQTDIPRDVEMEVAIIAARVMVMPGPTACSPKKQNSCNPSSGTSGRPIRPKSRVSPCHRGRRT